MNSAPQYLSTANDLLTRAGALAADGMAGEAEALLDEGVKQFPQAEGLLYEWCECAARRHDFHESLRRWAMLRERFPDHVFGYLGSARAHRDLGRRDLALEWFAEAVARFPGHRGALQEWAMYCAEQHLWADALRLYLDLREKFAGHAAGYLGVALSRFHLKDFAGAAFAYADASIRFPDDAGALIGWAEGVSGQATERECAIAAWAIVRRRFPDRCEGYARAAALLCQAGEFERADALLSDARSRFRANYDILQKSAVVSLKLGHFELAKEFYDEAIRVNNNNVLDIEVMGIDILRGLGLLIDAKSKLVSAYNRWGRHHDLEIAEIDICLSEGNLDRASAIYCDLKARCAGRAAIVDKLSERLGHVDERLLDLGAGTDPPSPESFDLKDMALLFESLGGFYEGCEFGIFQRACGVDPLGLLRWANIPMESLSVGLAAGFAGIGSAEQTIIEIDKNREYLVNDRIYRARMHTFMKEGDFSPGEVLRQVKVRADFLRGKLLDDLRNAEKIFVYKNSNRIASRQEILDLHNAIKQYGHATLLYVTYAPENNNVSKVKFIDDGLMIGYMSRFSTSIDGLDIGRAHEGWEEIMRAAFRLRWPWRVAKD